MVYVQRVGHVDSAINHPVTAATRSMSEIVLG